MSYTIAGIDVHKKLLVVVVAEVTEQGEWSYERMSSKGWCIQWEVNPSE